MRIVFNTSKPTKLKWRSTTCIYTNGGWLVYGLRNDPEWNRLTVILVLDDNAQHRKNASDCSTVENSERRKKAEEIMHMDALIRMINDKENEIFEG